MKLNLFLILLVCILFNSCKHNSTIRTIFPLMKEHYDFNDTLSNLNKYYSAEFNQFGLSYDIKFINKIEYYKINNYTKDNLFNLNGYLRFSNNMVYLLPLENGEKENNNENIFLNFNAKSGDKWDVCFDSKNQYCNQIEFYYSKYNKELKDSIYLFHFTYSKLQTIKQYEKPDIYVVVSKKYGITKILIIPFVNLITIIDFEKSQIISAKDIDSLKFM